MDYGEGAEFLSRSPCLSFIQLSLQIIFCCQHPLTVPPDRVPIKLSLVAAVEAGHIHRALHSRNVVARSIPVRVDMAAQPQRQGDDDGDGDSDDSNDDLSFGYGTRASVLYRGFITKQGWLRRNWKRRFFELYTMGRRHRET